MFQFNQMFSQTKDKQQHPHQSELKIVQTKIGKKSLDEAIRFVQDIIADQSVWGPDQASEHQRLLEASQSGDLQSIDTVKNIIEKILSNYSVRIDGYTLKEAAYKIYSVSWGLDILDQYYWDEEIDEVRVNSPNQIFVQRRGKNEKADVRFKDEEHVKMILGRLFIHDRGVALTSSTPVVESMRLDGTRVTATCPPATKCCTLVLRKHGTFKTTPENLVKAQTASMKVLELLKTLIEGRVNLLLSGGTGTGKTTLLRYLAGFIDPRLRIITLETDTEIMLGDYYPGRDIVEMEEHQELGFNLSEAFRTILRYSPDIIIVGEIRGKGEAIEAIKACVRGHNGSMATVHFGSPQEAIEGCGKMMLEEGLELPLDIASLWVADAFQVVVQMFADTTRGIKKITHITEVIKRNGKIDFRDLAVWKPSKEDFFVGDWVFPNEISPELLMHMDKYRLREGC